MFYAREDNNGSKWDSFAARIQGLGASAAQTAAQGVGSAAQTAAAGVGKGVRQGVYFTRTWTAPRLESAADYCTSTAAPKVSSALRAAAEQVRPDDLTRKKSRSALTWTVLAAAMAATAGSVAALVRYKLRASTATGPGEESGPAGPPAPGSGAAGAEGTTPASQGAAEGAAADADVNGRVSASGW